MKINDDDDNDDDDDDPKEQFLKQEFCYPKEQFQTYFFTFCDF